MAARTSSAERSALVESAPAIARVSDYLQQWKVRFAGTDWVPWLILALAAFLRFFLLGIKPPHFDEGINGWFVDQVMKNGFYRYDPTNYHGPLHFYVLLLFQSLFGRNVWALRLPVVLVSIACVWLALKFEPLVGRTVSRIAALAMAVSPGFVFYGRYAIHEVWLQFFSMMFILGHAELLVVRRRGLKRHDPHQRDLRHSSRLRSACNSNSGSFLRAKSVSGRQACKANLELDRSRHGRDRRRICHRLFLFGNFL